MKRMLVGVVLVLVVSATALYAKQNRSTVKGSELEVIETSGACVYVVRGQGVAAIPKAQLRGGVC